MMRWRPGSSVFRVRRMAGYTPGIFFRNQPRYRLRRSFNCVKRRCMDTEHEMEDVESFGFFIGATVGVLLSILSGGVRGEMPTAAFDKVSMNSRRRAS